MHVLHSCCQVTLFSRVWVFHRQLPGDGRYAISSTERKHDNFTTTNLQRLLLTVAISSTSTWRANALIIADAVNASGPITAGTRRAIVYVYSTIWTSETVGALAQEPVNAIYALSAVVAGLRTTVVDVILAVVSLETVAADALVVVASVDAGS